MRKIFFSILLAVLFLAPASAQNFPIDLPMPVVDGTTYDSSIPVPEDVIGHRIGNQHTIPSQVVQYFETLADLSDRVTLRSHGRTHEGRQLIHAIVTSPENHSNLEQIRQDNLKLSDAPAEVDPADLENFKLIVYLGYSVHGNESSGTEAAILTLYHLAAGNGQLVEDLLSNMVIIVDPMLNPDGRDRFTDWVNRNRGAVHTTDGQDREHNEPWPGGRTNHYWFDLNRDWLPAVHPESQGRLEVFHHWRPQVHTDVHEMGGNSTYFFQPGIPERTHHLTPPENQVLTAEIAAYHARALDSIGSLYYTEESFDDFYYGKASAYPDANGAIGILFEQASSRGLESETDRGDLHYAFTVRNQFVTSLSTLEASLHLKSRLLAFHLEFYQTSTQFASDIGVNAYVVDVKNSYARARHFVELLQRHRIRVHELTSDLTIDDYSFDANEALVIPAGQPQARFLRSLMETPTSFSDSIFYDVSTWNLPFSFNLPYRESGRTLAQHTGDVVDLEWFDRGRVIGSSSFSYVMPWRGYYAGRAAHQLTAEGFTLRVLKEPMSIMADGKRVDIQRGSVLIPVEEGRDGSEVQSIIERVALENNVIIYGASSGLTSGGPDLGTGTSARIPEISLGLITGSGTSAYNAGEVWHLLSVRFGLPVSLIDADALSYLDLNKYNVIVYAGGTTGTSVDPEIIKGWVRSGGTLITLDSGTSWAVNNELVTLTDNVFDVDSLVANYPYAELTRARGAKRLAGAAMNTDVDTTHPVAYGLSTNLPTFRTRTALYDTPDIPGATVAKYSGVPVLSGYVPEEIEPDISGKLAIGAVGVGRGTVVLFADNPNFRGYWYGTNMAFLNAIFLHRAI